MCVKYFKNPKPGFQNIKGKTLRAERWTDTHPQSLRDRCIINEPVLEISNIVVCATNKASDQPAHTRSLIRAFASRLSIL